MLWLLALVAWGFSWCWVLLVVVWVVLLGFVFDVQGFGLLGFGWVVLVMWLVSLLAVSVGWMFFRVWFSG